MSSLQRRTIQQSTSPIEATGTQLGIESQSKKAEKVSRGKEMDWDQAGIGGFGRKFLRATALKPAQNAALSIKYYQSLI